jgi:endo-1,4-beta-xylanase
VKKIVKIIGSTLIAVIPYGALAQAQDLDHSSLKTLADRHNLLIGGSSDLNHDDRKEEDIIAREYSILSNENCLKPHRVHPARNEYDFKQSDIFVNFCRENNIVAKGHKLIASNQYLPKWMLDPAITNAEQRTILVEHIETVMGRYKTGSPHGEIKYWDVLNEVLSYPSNFAKIGKNDDGDFLFWELAFQTARAVDPDAVLFWTEDRIYFDKVKAERLYDTIKRLKARGVPIDGVGFQGHIGYNGAPVPDYDYLAELFQKFADLGLYIAVTEMDVPEWMDQNEIYKGIMQVCLNQPKVISWSTWNVVDKYSWLNWYSTPPAHAPLLFDSDYNRKPTYYAVQSVLKQNNDNAEKRVLPHK